MNYFLVFWYNLGYNMEIWLKRLCLSLINYDFVMVLKCENMTYYKSQCGIEPLFSLVITCRLHFHKELFPLCSRKNTMSIPTSLALRKFDFAQYKKILILVTTSTFTYLLYMMFIVHAGLFLGCWWLCP